MKYKYMKVLKKKASLPCLNLKVMEGTRSLLYYYFTLLKLGGSRRPGADLGVP